MVGVGRKGQIEFLCPFCKVGKIQIYHKEGYIQSHKSHIAAGDKFTSYRVGDKYEVLEDCPNCHKSKKEIEANLEGKSTLSHEERLKKLKERGLPTSVEYR
jgi:rubredoxin